MCPLYFCARSNYICSSRTPRTGSQSQRKTPNTSLPIASSYQNCHGKQNTGKNWMEQCFIYVEKNWTRSALIVGVCPPWPASPPGSQQRAVGLCTPSSATAEGPCSLPLECEILKAGYVPVGHWHTHLSRMKEHSLTIKPRKKGLHKATSPAQAGWALISWWGQVPGLRSLLTWPNRGQKTVDMRQPFPAITISIGNFGLQGTENPTQTELAHVTEKVQQ